MTKELRFSAHLSKHNQQVECILMEQYFYDPKWFSGYLDEFHNVPLWKAAAFSMAVPKLLVQDAVVLLHLTFCHNPMRYKDATKYSVETQ